MIDDYPSQSAHVSLGLSRVIMQRVSVARQIVEEDILSTIELDSHADSAVVGGGCRIIERTGKKVHVSGFTDRLGKPMSVDVVHAGVMYDCDNTGHKYLCLIRNALYVPEMRECLIHPIMMRLVGIEVDECPKFLSPNPSINNHSIKFPDHDLRIPLKLHGVISYLPCRRPGEDEMVNNDGILELTPNVDVWDPRNLDFNEQEESMLDFSGNMKEPRPKKFIVSSVLTSSMDPNLFGRDIDIVFGVSSVRFLNSKEDMDPRALADKWNVSEKVARNTINATTRLCPRNTTSISLNRRYDYNDRMLRYRHLPVTMFSDTMFAARRVGKSVRNFTCAQIFATDFGWVGVVMMEFEREIPSAFKEIFKEICVPEKMVLDGARSQVKGEALKECRNAGCTIVELERGMPSANRAERTIGELKTDTKRDMNRARSPIVFWCYCIERRALINRSIAKNNFRLDKMSPYTYLTGELTDISNICSFA